MLKACLGFRYDMPLSEGVRLGHVNLEVSDLRRARQFYDRFLSVLGFRREMSNDPYWLGYRKGRTAIWVTVSRPPRVRRKAPHVPIDGVKDPISDHIAFAVPSGKRVADLEAALRRRGFRPVYSTDWQDAHGNRWYVSNAWRDPDNNVLEIYSLTRRR
ncbi:MAG TPA: VOC family protein [Thermoplasmata archaeon]|nr:VOC family protein [Thermoplasmata archaeon]